MSDDQKRVATSHWCCGPSYVAVAETTSLVDAFAGRHGMRAWAREDMTLAVSEVLAYVTEAQLAPTGPDGAVIDAAIDGRWMTVRVQGRRTIDDDGSLARTTAVLLADRVEWNATTADDVVVLMEFSTGGDCPAGLPAATARRAPSATVRRSPRGGTRTAPSRGRRPQCQSR